MRDDLIRRSDVYKAVDDWLEGRVSNLNIKDIPSADRPQGEWFKDENGDYRCSECGGCEEQFIYGTENWYGLGESKFCPSCGARMKGADDEV